MTGLVFILLASLVLVLARLIWLVLSDTAACLAWMSLPVAPLCVVTPGPAGVQRVRRKRAHLCDASSEDDPDASFPPQPKSVLPLIRAANRHGTSRRRFGVTASWLNTFSRA